jgi:predicted ATPase/class 3 adenylate cyclase
VAACNNCGKANPEGARFCSFCAAPLAAEPPPAQEVRKTVTAVFCGAAGSTSERLDPESLRGLMTRYFDEMKRVVEGHGGTVRGLVGDSFMAVFGTPVAHEDDAVRAVRAASEMSERLPDLNDELERDWGVRLAVRTGVNSGEVMAEGPGGSDTLVLGDSVNVAARLEQAANPGEILLGEATYTLVRDAVEVEPVAPLALKGKGEPVPAWRLVSVTRVPDAPGRRLDSPLVGRERELELLRRAFERAVGENACELVTVLGPAGVGKSRLTREFLGDLGEEATILRGRCLPYGEGITFWPIAEVVREAAAMSEADPPEAARAKIAAVLRESEDAGLIAERVAAAIGLPGEGGELQEIFWAIRKLFEGLARERSLVCVFDDVHWAEPAFLDLVEYVVGWTRDVPLLLLCLARPELLESAPSWPSGTLIALEPLSEDESRRLIASLLGAGALADEVTLRVGTAAEGNPLFVEELLRMLVDEGTLERRNGDWQATHDLAELAIPPTIQALLAARLDRLAPAEREVIQRASVAGKTFWWGAVAELSPESARPEVGTHLQTLVRKELIRPDPTSFVGEDGFRFGHILVRDAAYQSIPKAARGLLHKQFAAWLERKAGERASEYEEIVGYHLEQAFRYASEFGPVDDSVRALATGAGERLASAGLRARTRTDMAAAANLLARAVTLLPDSTERLELMPGLADALVETGELARAEAVLSEAADQAAAAGDSRIELLAQLERLSVQERTKPAGQRAEIAKLAERAIPVFEEAGDEAALARAWDLLGDVYSFACRWGAAAEALERALAHARRGGDRREEAEILAWLAVSLLLGSTSAPEGIRRCEEILERAEGQRRVEASILGSLGWLHAMRGDFDEGRALYRRGQAIYDDLGFKLRAAARTQVGGTIELLAGDPAAAEEELRWGYETLEALGEKSLFSTVSAILARAIYAQGRFDEAERVAEVGRQAAGDDDVISQVLWRGTQAKVLARRGELGEAERLAREGVALIEQTDHLDGHGDALLDLADVLRLAGRDDEAVPVVEAALELYERKGNVVSAVRARELLNQEAAPR